MLTTRSDLHGLLAQLAPLDPTPTLPLERLRLGAAVVRLDRDGRLTDQDLFAELGWTAGSSVIACRHHAGLRVRTGTPTLAGELRCQLDARGRLLIPRLLRRALDLRPGEALLAAVHDDALHVQPVGPLLADLLTPWSTP